MNVSALQRHLERQAADAAEVAAHEARAALGAPPVARNGWTCPECGGETESGPDQPNCPCIEEAAKAARAKVIEEEWDDVANTAWRYVDVAPRFRDVTLSNFEPRKGAERALRACQVYAQTFERGKTAEGIYLFGRYGSGKTHLAVATARRILERTLADPVITVADRFINEFKGSGFERAVLENVLRADLVVLDDLGQSRANDFQREVIHEIIDYRYHELLPVILTSNLGDEDLIEMYGGAMVSRIWEMCDGIEVKAPDYRRELATRKQQ